MSKPCDIKAFIENCCWHLGAKSENATAMYRAYYHWASTPLPRRAFDKAMARRYAKSVEGNTKVWVGVQLKIKDEQSI